MPENGTREYVGMNRRCRGARMVGKSNDPTRISLENIAEGVVYDPRPGGASDRDAGGKRRQGRIGIGRDYDHCARVGEANRFGLILGFMRFAGAELRVVLRSSGFLFRLAAARRFFHVPSLRATAAAERHRHKKRE